METSTERHITNPLELARLAKAVDTLVILGRPLNQALYDVAQSYGLTRTDVNALIRLIK